MSFAWEDFENRSKLNTTKVKQEIKPRADKNTKIPCPYCGHLISSSKDIDIACYRCGKRFDRYPDPKLSFQEVPTVLVKQNEIQIGRWCKCGCSNKIPLNARKDRLYFNATCRRVYLNRIEGYTESKFVFRARIRINEPRTIFIYPIKGQQFKIPITKECKELFEFCEKMEKSAKEHDNQK